MADTAAVAVTWRIIHGDCVEKMAAMAEASVDAVVCDPPYGLEFMGKEWDRLGATTEPFREQVNGDGRVDFHGKGNAPFGGGGNRVRYGASAMSIQAWHETWAREALRVLRPGGHLLAFGGTRTYHRLAAGIEDAGFEIRDTIAWMYGSGFPKSLDVGKAIDRAAGAVREVVGSRPIAYPDSPSGYTSVSGNATARGGGIWSDPEGEVSHGRPVTASATPEAERWQGWGTALKPAHEPVVVARKPLVGTVAANVLAHGTGGLNIDACRIGMSDADAAFIRKTARPNSAGEAHEGSVMNRPSAPTVNVHESGRWPANVVLDEEAAAVLDAQTGMLHGEGSNSGSRSVASGSTNFAMRGGERVVHGDSGGASRFFYVAKASSAERESGPRKNVHPTVKPVELMRWLVRLVTPLGGTVLDPFTGSGSTGAAALLEGFDFVGIEREAEYAEIAEARIRWWAQHPDGMQLVRRLEFEREQKAKSDAGQMDLFGS